MKVRLLIVCSVLLLLGSGCSLKEVRSKTKAGPEFRHSGSSNTNSDRWTVEQGVEFKWDNGVNTGLTYRRRDVDDGNGDNENRVMFDISFPLWKAKPKQAQLARRVKFLEERLAALEVSRAEKEK